MLSENTSQGPDLATRDSRTNTLVAMRSCRAVAPDIAYTSPATYSCLTGYVSSNRKYSSTVIVGSADESCIPHGTLGDTGGATGLSPSEALSCRILRSEEVTAPARIVVVAGDAASQCIYQLWLRIRRAGPSDRVDTRNVWTLRKTFG